MANAYSKHTAAFGKMVMRLLTVIEKYPEPSAAWEDGTAHLFVWADRDPELLRSVDALGNVTPLGNTPPSGNIAKTDMMLAGLMDHAEKDAALIDDWRAGTVVLVFSADGTRKLPADALGLG